MVRLAGSSVSSFTWSTSEQVYPFEKDVNGNTLYCKEINFGAWLNNGTKTVAHNISGLSAIHRYEGFGISTNGPVYKLPHVHPGNIAYVVHIRFDATNCYVLTGTDYTDVTSSKLRVIYTKS